MPTAEAICAMVEAGWSYETLMFMRPGEWSFWFRAHLSLQKQREKNRRAR